MSEQFSHLSSEELRQELVKNGLLPSIFLIYLNLRYSMWSNWNNNS